MVTEVSAVKFRQNLGEMLNQVQYRNDSILIKKKMANRLAALVDANLFARIQFTSDIMPGRVTEEFVQKYADELSAQMDLEDLRLQWISPTEVNLNRLSVAKEHRGQRKGTIAMNCLMAWADAYRIRLTLTANDKDDVLVATSKARLVKFFRKFGFVPNNGKHTDFTLSQGMYRDPTPMHLRGREHPEPRDQHEGP